MSLHAQFCDGELDLATDRKGVPYRYCRKCGSIIREKETLSSREYETLLRAFEENAVLKQRLRELESCQTKS